MYMSVSPERLKSIMGEPNSPTGKLVRMRRRPTDGELDTGVWYSDFTRVKTEAERRGIPFFAMWTNGDLCGFCRRFTKNILDPWFIERMTTSGGLWWLGGSMDDNDEDKRGGVGFNWCTGPDHSVNYFPFFTVVQSVNGKVEHGFFGSGHDYDQRKSGPEATKLIMQKIGSILADKPSFSAEGKSAPAAGLRIRLNPSWDPNHVVRFQTALSDNGGHCVCQKDKTPDTLCLCRAFMEQQTPGFCHCGAYEKYMI